MTEVLLIYSILSSLFAGLILVFQFTNFKGFYLPFFVIYYIITSFLLSATCFTMIVKFKIKQKNNYKKKTIKFLNDLIKKTEQMSDEEFDNKNSKILYEEER